MKIRGCRWLIGLAVPMLLGSMVLAAPATPAVPGGGNPHNDNPNAATPAVPGGGNLHNDNPNAATPAAPANEPGPDDMDDRDAGDFVGQHPDLRDDARARWEAMTPEQREQFLRDHPGLARRMLRRTWDRLTPAERAQFIRNHPELRDRLVARWRSMTPDERRAFCQRHPRLVRRATHRMRREGRAGQEPGARQDRNRDRGNQGVRDHGAGQGRGGVGQGGEHRSPQGGLNR